MPMESTVLLLLVKLAPAHRGNTSANRPSADAAITAGDGPGWLALARPVRRTEQPPDDGADGERRGPVADGAMAGQTVIFRTAPDTLLAGLAGE